MTDTTDRRKGMRRAEDAQVNILAHRLDAIEGRQTKTEQILESVADSLKQLVLIEHNQRQMTQDVAAIKESLNGTGDRPGLITRLTAAESRIDNHRVILTYVGAAIGTGIAGGLTYIVAAVWHAAMRAGGGP